MSSKAPSSSTPSTSSSPKILYHPNLFPQPPPCITVPLSGSTVLSSLLILHKPFNLLIDTPPITSLPTSSTLKKFINSSFPNENIRPCHQLDYSTSGLILYALDKEVNKIVVGMFEERKVRKVYSFRGGEWGRGKGEERVLGERCFFFDLESWELFSNYIYLSL